MSDEEKDKYSIAPNETEIKLQGGWDIASTANSNGNMHELSTDFLETRSTKELKKMLNGEIGVFCKTRNPKIYRLVETELKLRQMKSDNEKMLEQMKENTKLMMDAVEQHSKPHWSTTPIFWLVVITLIFTIFDYQTIKEFFLDLIK